MLDGGLKWKEIFAYLTLVGWTYKNGSGLNAWHYLRPGRTDKPTTSTDRPTTSDSGGVNTQQNSKKPKRFDRQKLKEYGVVFGASESVVVNSGTS